MTEILTRPAPFTVVTIVDGRVFRDEFREASRATKQYRRELATLYAHDKTFRIDLMRRAISTMHCEYRNGVQFSVGMGWPPRD